MDGEVPDSALDTFSQTGNTLLVWDDEGWRRGRAHVRRTHVIMTVLH